MFFLPSLDVDPFWVIELENIPDPGLEPSAGVLIYTGRILIAIEEIMYIGKGFKGMIAPPIQGLHDMGIDDKIIVLPFKERVRIPVDIMPLH